MKTKFVRSIFFSIFNMNATAKQSTKYTEDSDYSDDVVFVVNKTTFDIFAISAAIWLIVIGVMLAYYTPVYGKYQCAITGPGPYDTLRAKYLEEARTGTCDLNERNRTVSAFYSPCPFGTVRTGIGACTEWGQIYDETWIEKYYNYAVGFHVISVITLVLLVIKRFE
mgnify:CR=1 FL=1